MHWDECTKEQTEAAAEKESKRKGAHKGNGSNGDFISYERLLKYLKPTERYIRQQLRQIGKKELNKGKDWVDDAIKALVEEKKFLRSIAKNYEGGSYAFFHLPTPMEQEGTNEF